MFKHIKLWTTKNINSCVIIFLSLFLTLATLAFFFLCSIFSDDYQLTGIYILSVALIVIGLYLPKYANKKDREKLSKKWRGEEKKKWGFTGRKRNNIWINYIDRPIIKNTILAKDRKFYSEWLIIDDELIIVNPGSSKMSDDKKSVTYDYTVKRTYAWDGCSPKLWFYWFALIGTPDWAHQIEPITSLNEKGEIITGKKIWQQAHHASLVHDALYQYLGLHPITKHEADLLFYEMLLESGMHAITAKIYHCAVIKGGGREIDKHHRPENTELVDSVMPKEK